MMAAGRVGALAVLCALVALAAAHDGSVLFRVRAMNDEAKMFATASCVDMYRRGGDMFEYIGRQEDAAMLEKKGFEIVETELSRPLRIDPPSGYHTPEMLMEAFRELETRNPDYARLIDLTSYYEQAPGHEGGHIWAIKISDNVSADEDEENYLIVANHHARELVTPEIALNVSQKLLYEYYEDETIRWIVDNHQVYVVWTMNPDGLNYVWEADNMWRKNRRRNSGGSYGVDQNRNYPVGWDFSCGGSQVEASETYRGPSAASEPETQTMLAFQLDRYFSKVIDFHSYAREVRINYGDCASLPKSVDDYFKAIAQSLADDMQYEQARSCCMGGNIHAAYHDYGSLAFLVETATAFQPPASQMEEELVRIWPGILNFLTLPTPISGRILDAKTNEPVYAHIEVHDLEFELEETKSSNPYNGLYHLWLPDGNYTITVTSPTHAPVTVSAFADNSNGTILDIFL